MIAPDEHIRRAVAWRQLFTRALADALRASSRSVTISLDDADLQQLIDLCAMVEEAEIKPWTPPSLNV